MKRDTAAGIEFTQREKRVKEMLYTLFADVETLRESFDGQSPNWGDGRTNWGLVGDLGHAEQLLNEVHNFLANKE